MASKTITVKLKKSVIGSNQKVRGTVRGLGLKKTNSSRTLENTPAVRGMIKKVIHLLEVTE
ncbi:MAG: 50S ribosomal protein L30 [Bacteriovoracaceae bacterium]|jgi:large subunit ribosomal protein L30|nr:50S ribosomal protein L30 [Bacteriovoracaceae bacterium]